jgi:hypothetical protein
MELETVLRLWESGTPIIGFGGDDQAPEALKFWTEGTEKRKAGEIEYFIKKNTNGVSLIYCPLNGSRLPAADTAALMTNLMEDCKVKIVTSPQLVVNPFFNNDTLFLGLGTLSDQNVSATVRLTPEQWCPEWKNKTVKVIDLGCFREILPDADGNYVFPFEAVSGKMLMIMKGE